jgi:hypothetical protein
MSKGMAVILFEVAFDPMSIRTPRSIEYMEGARAALENAEHASDAVFIPRKCPYQAGSVGHDAWYAGAEEGRRLWRVNAPMLAGLSKASSPGEYPPPSRCQL